MALGPIEVLVIDFPEARFNGSIVPELERLVAAGTISIIDGILIQKDADGEVEFSELQEEGLDADVALLSDLVGEITALISDEDAIAFADELEPGSAAAVLVFEHTWAKPLRDVIVEAGGRLAANFQIPGAEIDELLSEIEAAG